MTDTVRPVGQPERLADREPVNNAGQEPVDSPEPVRPREPRPPRRRMRPVMLAVMSVLIVAMFAGAALGYSQLQPTVYGAETDVLLTIRPDISDAAADRAMVTQTMVVQSPSVLQVVASRTGVPLAELQDAVSAAMISRSNILRITVADRDPARAVRIAEAVAGEYLRLAPPPTAARPAAPATTAAGAGRRPAAGPARRGVGGRRRVAAGPSDPALAVLDVTGDGRRAARGPQLARTAAASGLQRGAAAARVGDRRRKYGVRRAFARRRVMERGEPGQRLRPHRRDRRRARPDVPRQHLPGHQQPADDRVRGADRLAVHQPAGAVAGAPCRRRGRPDDRAPGGCVPVHGAGVLRWA